MNQSDNQKNDLYDLFGALCNETITPEQHAILENRLAEDAEARQDYFHYLELNLNLERLHDEQPQTDIDFHFHAQELTAFPTEVPAKNTFKTSQTLWLMVTAICVTIVASFLFLSPKPSTPTQVGQVVTPSRNTSVAEVKQTAGVRFAEGAPLLRVGSLIETYQEYAISEGQIQIVFVDGAEVILTGPAVFECEGKEHLAVRYGSCSVYAPEGAEGFTVETPLSNVVDYGTRFSVNVSEAGNTDVQVIEGETDVRPLKQNDDSVFVAKRLTRGMAQRLTTDNGLVVDQIPFDSKQYVSGLPDRVVSYTTTVGPRRKAEDLTSVTIQRGGIARHYAVEDLIGVELTHYTGSSFLTRNDGIDPANDENPLTLRRHLLDQDRSLLTGVVNPSGSTSPLTVPPVMNEVEDPAQPNTPGMAIRFKEPVVNEAGPDIVLFDLQVIVHPTAGDAFFVTPLPFTSKRNTHKIAQFDIDLASSEAKSLEKFWLHIFNQKERAKINSRAGLETALGNGGNLHTVGAKALAVGIDLSDLGFAEGETVEGLFIQDVQDDNNFIDPVFIAGLPSIKDAPQKINKK